MTGSEHTVSPKISTLTVTMTLRGEQQSKKWPQNTPDRDDAPGAIPCLIAKGSEVHQIWKKEVFVCVNIDIVELALWP